MSTNHLTLRAAAASPERTVRVDREELAALLAERDDLEREADTLRRLVVAADEEEG